MENSEQAVARRVSVLARHFTGLGCDKFSSLDRSLCLEYSPPEDASEKPVFDPKSMNETLVEHNAEERDWLFKLMASNELFGLRRRGGNVYCMPDYNQPMEHQREMTMQRILFLRDKGVFKGWLTNTTSESDVKRYAAWHECMGLYDHSLAIKLGVHMHLWGLAIKYLGTERHHKKWLQATEDFDVIGCFAMTELGHGSNVRGIETVTIYDSTTQEFIVTTPCETAQKYWIGGAANDATHALVFSQLIIHGKNEGVHAFIVQLRNKHGKISPGIRIADCGHKIGLNGVDNGRIWFDGVRIPRENILNSAADVSPNGEYQSLYDDPDKRFAAFMAPLTYGRVIIAVSAVQESMVGVAIAVRYALSRRAFQLSPDTSEILLLDYPAHRRRLLPLLAKTYAMRCAANDLKRLYWRRNPEDIKEIHVLSSGFKAMFSWHNMRTLQECREACGGQGLNTENRIGHLKGEYDVQLTFEGDNNILVQQVSKALLAEYHAAHRKRKPLSSLGLEHMNKKRPIIPTILNSSILRDVEFQINIFCLRERHLLEHLALEISSLTSQGQTETVAFNTVHALAEDLGRSYTQRRVLDSFLSAERNATDMSIKNILGVLRALYALVILEEDVSLLRYGFLSPQHSQFIQKEVAKLCNEVRPHALSLVDSFGIPQAFLSPLAFNWIEANSWEDAVEIKQTS
eukprot:TRINITY_DN4526_c0_g2_i1.p1 TRINITY_DN4526_c0_g2~~TRINITY_DN4526_c0_g2_i1.p1  ORF type:complete len:721 (+),score=118.07 TRINITY_DN4526_c0_g2_i1:107-2164(+)